MAKVYAVGVIQADLSENPRRFIIESRLWYLFDKFENAEKCVLENQSDIFEFYYNMAVIEEIHLPDTDLAEDETVSYTPKQWWYKVTYVNGGDHQDDIIERVERPAIMQNISNIWVG